MAQRGGPRAAAVTAAPPRVPVPERRGVVMLRREMAAAGAARCGVVWGSCGSRHSSAPPGGGCRGTRRSPVPAGVVTAGSGRECRVDAGLKPKEFMPEAQAVSFSFRARQLELILHRISSEPKWDYL